jgi:antitoxin HigA-1
MARTMKRLPPRPGSPMTHPGTHLPEMIEAIGLTIAEFAKRLGVTRKAVYDILDGKSGISVGMALRLERVFGSTAEFWLNLQMQYDL